MSRYLRHGDVLLTLLALERERGVCLLSDGAKFPLNRPLVELAADIDVPDFPSWEVPRCNSGRERAGERDPGCSLKRCRHTPDPGPAQDFSPCAGTGNRRVRIFLEREYARLVMDGELHEEELPRTPIGAIPGRYYPPMGIFGELP